MKGGKILSIKEKPRMGPGELQLTILKILEQKELSVKEICAALTGDYAYTTILTTLSRMFQKGLVERCKTNHFYTYSLPKIKSKHSLLNRIKERLFANQTASMIHYLIETSEGFSQNEIEQIEHMIQKYKK